MAIGMPVASETAGSSSRRVPTRRYAAEVGESLGSPRRLRIVVGVCEKGWHAVHVWKDVGLERGAQGRVVKRVCPRPVRVLARRHPRLLTDILANILLHKRNLIHVLQRDLVGGHHVLWLRVLEPELLVGIPRRHFLRHVGLLQKHVVVGRDTRRRSSVWVVVVPIVVSPPRWLPRPPRPEWACCEELLSNTGLDCVAGRVQTRSSSLGKTNCSHASSNLPADIRSNARRSSICKPLNEYSSAVLPRFREVLKGSSTHNPLLRA